MIRFFKDYCNQLFPSIDTSVKNSVKEAILQINMTRNLWFNFNLLDKLSQGDILDKIPFRINNNEVASNTILIKEMVISNTCDLQRNKDFRIDPLLEII